ncbi:guanine nucleotide binding protein, alpha subunit [Chytridium lagenaria]|nr:guanine nucleotide binding protein, alpha subunit [Chytridium lagenaria]
MGNCSSSPEEAEARQQSNRIDRDLKSDKKDDAVKLLLLGSGESGKSTVLKQFRLIHGLGFSNQERNVYRSAILGNVISCAKTLVNAMEDLNIPYSNPSDYTSLIRSAPFSFGEGEVVPVQLVDAMNSLWADAGIQTTSPTSRDFCSTKFVPTDQDILAARVMTTTITETRVQIDEAVLKIYDVGGQRSERKKWAPYFDDVVSIIFVSAISSFDQTCFEDSTTNRMLESLSLFGSICNHPLFKDTAMILFLNKIDLFKKKLKTTSISNYFKDYNGSNTFEDGGQYFTQKFLALNKFKERKYFHLTWATDTSQIRAVLRAVHSIIVKLNLREAGL